MRSSLGLTLANILRYHKTTCLDQCSKYFLPLLYRRYVDDTFLTFTDQSYITLFQHCLNNQLPNLKCTVEFNINNKLPFLDIQLSLENQSFSTYIYRKNASSRHHFFRQYFIIHKLNAIQFDTNITLQ